MLRVDGLRFGAKAKTGMFLLVCGVEDGVIVMRTSRCWDCVGVVWVFGKGSCSFDGSVGWVY